jgi:hypothetical protein
VCKASVTPCSIFSVSEWYLPCSYKGEAGDETPTRFRLPLVTQEAQGHCPAGQGPLEDEGFFSHPWCSLIVLSYLCHARCLSEVQKHVCDLLMPILFMSSLSMCSILFYHLCSLTYSYHLHVTRTTCLSEAQKHVYDLLMLTVYVKPYYVLYHVLSSVSNYYHIYIMLHAYQKFRNMSAIC